MTTESVVREVLESYGEGYYNTALNVSLDDLGLDSLEMVEMINTLEDKLSILLDEKKLDGVKTVQDVIDLAKEGVRRRGHLWPACPSPHDNCDCGFSQVFWEDVDNYRPESIVE